jgi:hypothetical protein
MRKLTFSYGDPRFSYGDPRFSYGDPRFSYDDPHFSYNGSAYLVTKNEEAKSTMQCQHIIAFEAIKAY